MRGGNTNIRERVWLAWMTQKNASSTGMAPCRPHAALIQLTQRKMLTCRPGSVGFVSKSGGMSNEMYNVLARATDGLFEGKLQLYGLQR